MVVLRGLPIRFPSHRIRTVTGDPARFIQAGQLNELQRLYSLKLPSLPSIALTNDEWIPESGEKKQLRSRAPCQIDYRAHFLPLLLLFIYLSIFVYCFPSPPADSPSPAGWGLMGVGAGAGWGYS